MEGDVVTGARGFYSLRPGTIARVCAVLLLGAGGAAGQTQGTDPLPEPLPEPPATTATPLDDAGAAQGDAGIEADRTDPDATGAAESEDRETAAPSADADVLPAPMVTRSEPAPPLRDQIATCYPGDAEASGGESVTISFVLDSAGLLLGIPNHVGDEAQSAVQRRLFLDAVVALEECAPYSVSGSKTTYEAMFTPGTVSAVNIVDSAPLVTEPEVMGTARANPSAVATEEIEDALDLSRGERREVQNRLRLVAHDPGGADGVFGPNTRTAISSWQTERGFPASGYLDDVQLSALREQSETEYQAFLETQPEPRSEPERNAERVRVCKRGVFGVLYDCRFVWR